MEHGGDLLAMMLGLRACAAPDGAEPAATSKTGSTMETTRAGSAGAANERSD